MTPRPWIEPEGLLAHAGWMRELASSLLGDPAAADDVVQEAWVAALRHAPDSGRPLEPWLSRVIRNFAWKRRRSDKRRADHEALAPAREPEPSPEQTLERLELQRKLVELVAQIDEPLRTTLVLRYFEGRTSAEIARAHGLPEGTVRWRLKRGLEELRTRLDTRFGTRESWSALLLPLAFPKEAVAVGGSIGAYGAAQGVLTMSVALKAAVAVSVVAITGAVWWARSDGGKSAEPRLEAASNELEAPAAPPARPDSEPQGASREAALVTPAVAESSPAPEPARAAEVATKPGVIAPATVDVRFLDANGAPFAEVLLDCPDDAKIGSARSGTDGRAELKVPVFAADYGRHVIFRGSRRGCATVVIDATLTSGDHVHLGDVVLVPGVTLSGRVVDEQGRGIAEAMVGISVPDLEDDDDERMHRHGSSTFGQHAMAPSSADGSFALEGVAVGKWRLWGGADGYRFAWTEPFDVQLADRFDLALVLQTLRPEDRIEGRVVDPEGNPVPHADLLLCYEGQHESGSTDQPVDGEGRFRLLIYVEGTYRVFASDPAHRYATGAAFGLKPGMLDVVVRLPEKRFVEVRATDEGGAKVTDVALRVREVKESRSEAVAKNATSDGNARFQVPGYPFRIAARAEGFREATVGPFEPSTVGPHIDLVLERVPRVRGRVTAGGTPVSNAQVLIVRAVEEGAVVKNGFPMRMSSDSESTGRTRADGTFELDVDLEPRVDLFVRVLSDEWATAELGPKSLETLVARELDLELTRGGAIEGRVILPDGRDGEGAIVGINCGDEDALTKRAGPGGAFRFERLKPGKWQVLSRTEEVRPDSVTVSASDQGVPIAWSCEVHDGRTTHFDLDLSRQ